MFRVESKTIVNIIGIISHYPQSFRQNYWQNMIQKVMYFSTDLCQFVLKLVKVQNMTFCISDYPEARAREPRGLR